jgi:hypothetical protein
MADLTLGNTADVTDKRAGRGNTTATSIIAEIGNYDTIADIKARLTALNATSYTAARMQTMTYNDLVYALRIASADAAGI